MAQNWTASRSDLSEAARQGPVIGLVLQRSHIVTGDEAHYVAIIQELEYRGATVIPVFCGGLDFTKPVNAFFYDPLNPDVPLVDGVVSLTGFALVGGPARQDHPKAIEVLQKLNRPYMVALPLVFQTTQEWEESDLGLHPVQVALQIAIPELDGAIEPIVLSGRDDATGKAHTLQDRVDAIAERCIRWASLRIKPRTEKKLAITVFSFPPDKGNVGTAAYLDVFGSIYRVLEEMRAKGYDAVSGGNAESFGAPETVVAYAEGQREAEALRSVGWQDLLRRMCEEYPVFVAEFDAVAKAADEAERADAQLLLDHEVALLDYAAAALAGRKDSLHILERFLAKLHV